MANRARRRKLLRVLTFHCRSTRSHRHGGNFLKHGVEEIVLLETRVYGATPAAAAADPDPSERIRLTAPAAVFVTYWMEGWTLAASIEPCIPHVSNFAPCAVVSHPKP